MVPAPVVSCSSNCPQISAYSTACYDCQAEEECTNCTVQNGAEVQVFEPVLPHTASPHADGTIESLELHRGFWRSSPISKDVRECYEEKACIGGTYNYCAAGYTGPCKYFDLSR